MSEEAAEAPKEAKAKKGKREKRKKDEKGVFSLYKIIDRDKVVRQRPTCERCGPGYFMADHGDRYSCGHCGFTRYKHV